MKIYNKYKKLYGKNTIILMQLGSFYEMLVLNENDKYGELDIYNISNNILNIAVATKKINIKIKIMDQN